MVRLPVIMRRTVIKYLIKQFRLVVFLLVLVFEYSNAQAQKSLEPLQKENFKHSLNVELLGKGFYFANISYEYTVKPKLSLGIGLGFMRYSRGQSNRMHDGISETGKYTYLTLFIPVYATYKIGKNQYHVLLSAGNALVMFFSFHTFPSEKTQQQQLLFSPFVSLGYQYDFKKFFYRINLYAEYVGRTAWTSPVMPWVGFGFGRYFP